MVNTKSIFVLFFFLPLFTYAGARLSASPEPQFSLPDELEFEADADSIPADPIFPETSKQHEVEYEPLAAGPGGSSLVRKDGLSTDTINKINLYFKIYGILPNPLKEREAKILREEVNQAQFYYVRKDGVRSIPKELKELGSHANILYQNTTGEHKPTPEPPELSPQNKKNICDKPFPNGMKDLYLKICVE